MTPKKIANNLALVVMSDLSNVDQSIAAVTLLQKTIPHLRNLLNSPVEIASDTAPEDLLKYYAGVFEGMLLHASEEYDAEGPVSDADIENDGVSDEEEEESDLFVPEEAKGSSLSVAVAQLVELAAGSVIRDKGKFLPLDDIEIVELDKKEKEDANQIQARRVTVSGRIKAAE